MIIQFYKYQGTGNDFVILDNRNGQYQGITEHQIRFICHRKFGVGADGLMMLTNCKGYDFEMSYFNSNGKPGSMCGNGGRCMVKFALDLGIINKDCQFLAVDGLHLATIDENGIIKLKMKEVNVVENHFDHFVLDTGSPHYVTFVKDLENYDVTAEGKKIRYNEVYSEKGINVNFVERLNDDVIFVRTYERGVEEETMSCGTGVTASSLMAVGNNDGFHHVKVKTLGGHLNVEFEKINEQQYKSIWLCGPAQKVFQGEMEVEDNVL